MTRELEVPDPVPGDLEVWYIPQIPGTAFRERASDLATAKKILDVLSRFSLFEFENRVKPDYADAGGIHRWESDGEGGYRWYDVDIEREEMSA